MVSSVENKASFRFTGVTVYDASKGKNNSIKRKQLKRAIYQKKL